MVCRSYNWSLPLFVSCDFAPSSPVSRCDLVGSMVPDKNRLVPIAAILSMAILSSLWCSKVRALIMVNKNGDSSDWRMPGILIPWFWNESSKRALKLCFAAFARLFSVFSWVYEAFCLFVMGHITYQLLKYLRIFVSQDSSDLSKMGYQAVPWNMGQIIAVLVWSPVLARYLYALFCKLLRWFMSSLS